MDLIGLAERVVPILVFLVAMTVLAELSDRIGVFARIAAVAARLGPGLDPGCSGCWSLRPPSLVTAVLSLDTTAVLVTPVALALARRLGVDRVLFAYTTVWLANTASLFLPVVQSDQSAGPAAVGRVRAGLRRVHLAGRRRRS